MYRLWFAPNGNKVGFIRSCHFQGQSKVSLHESGSRFSFSARTRARQRCSALNDTVVEVASSKQHTSSTCTHFKLWIKHCNGLSPATRDCASKKQNKNDLFILQTIFVLASTSVFDDHKVWLYVAMCIFVLPNFFVFSLLMKSLSFTDLIACNEFLIQARIDLHMLTPNGQWGICWKTLITSGAWQQLFPPSFYLKKCHCANGGHISTLSSPVPSAGQQHWVSI